MTESRLVRSREQMWSDLLVALGGSESYKTMSEEQMLAAIRNTYGGSISALTTSETDLLASIVSAAGGSASDLTLDEEQMLAAMLNALGGSGSALTSSPDAILAASVAAAAGGSSEPYAMTMVRFDGTKWLSNDSLTSADGDYIAFSMWVKMTDADWEANQFSPSLAVADATDQLGFNLIWYQINTVNYHDALHLSLNNPDGSNTINLFRSDAPRGELLHVLGCVYTNAPDGEKVGKLYINDVDVTGFIDGQGPCAPILNGKNFRVGEDGFGVIFNGDIGDFRLMTGTNLFTGSDIAEATRRLFIDADGQAVNPAVATAALGAPTILFSLNNQDSTPFSTNRGSGGAFTLHGTEFDPAAAYASWPDATTTGYRLTLTPHAGDYTTTADGEVISGLDISGGGIIVQHDNVTIVDCAIHGAEFGVNDTTSTGAPHSGLVVRHCEIYNVFTGIYGGGLFEFNNIHDCENGITVSGLDGVVIQHNYIHSFSQAGDPHYDGIELYSQMNNVTIFHNFIDLDHGFTGTINMAPTFGPVSNVVIDSNKLVGGSFTVYMIDGGVGLELSNVTLTDNLLGIGANGLYSIGGVTPTMSGNYTTEGWYVDGDVPPIEGTVVFSPSAALASSDTNINAGFRMSALLAANMVSDVRVVFKVAGAAMELLAAGFGKVASGDDATAALTPFTFGGLGAPSVDVNQDTYIVTDWMPLGGLSILSGDRMLVGLKLGNPGGTGISSGNSNVSTYYNADNSQVMAQAPSGYSNLSGGGVDYALYRIETR